MDKLMSDVGCQQDPLQLPHTKRNTLDPTILIIHDVLI